MNLTKLTTKQNGYFSFDFLKRFEREFRWRGSADQVDPELLQPSRIAAATVLTDPLPQTTILYNFPKRFYSAFPFIYSEIQPFSHSNSKR